MEWPLDEIQWQVGLGIAVVLLAVVLLVVVLWRRRTGRKRESAEPLDLQLTFGAYRESHPSFFRVMLSFQEKHQLQELLAKGEVRAAVKLLESQRKTRKAKPGRGSRKASVLTLSQPPAATDETRRIQAAMLTILRAIYQEESFRKDLSDGADEELDHLLESLTG